jgi:DNA-directed RNA polymerase specialized sigma24 family protein
MDSRPGDEMLLLAVAERDMGAFRTLYERHAGWLAIRLARRCNDRDLVADAVQDTFVAVWQRPRGFRGDGDIGQALARLSPEMRAVIQAVVLDGLSAREAAQLLHVPVSSVKTRLYRAKAHLRAALAEGPS